MDVSQLAKLTDEAVLSAELLQSRLKPEASIVAGRIGDKVRHLLNNLCAVPDTVYLEAGLYQGSSLVAALSGNESTVQYAYAIDNWRQTFNHFRGRADKEVFLANVRTHLNAYQDRLEVHDVDLFSFDISKLRLPPTVVYYDANHDRTYEAMEHLLPSTDNPFVLVLDDWRLPAVSSQWGEFLKDGLVSVKQEWTLGDKRKDFHGWWCGMYAAVLEHKG